MTTRQRTQHYRIPHTAGDGYHEPRERWISCACGAVIWSWQQFYDENPDDPDDCWVEHMAEVDDR